MAPSRLRLVLRVYARGCPRPSAAQAVASLRRTCRRQRLVWEPASAPRLSPAHVEPACLFFILFLFSVVTRCGAFWSQAPPWGLPFWFFFFMVAFLQCCCCCFPLTALWMAQLRRQSPDRQSIQYYRGAEAGPNTRTQSTGLHAWLFLQLLRNPNTKKRTREKRHEREKDYPVALKSSSSRPRCWPPAGSAPPAPCCRRQVPARARSWAASLRWP